MNQNSNTTGRLSSADGPGKKPLTEEAKQVATTAASQVKDVASSAVDQVKQQATARIGSQKDRAVEKISDVASAVRAAGDAIDDGPLPDLAERAADGIEGLANYFKSRTIGDLVGEVERFGRREPAIFLGASFALGLIGGRFLKSSSNTRTRRAQARDTFDGHRDDVHGDHFGDDPFGVDEDRFHSMHGLDYVPPPRAAEPPARVQVREMISVDGDQTTKNQPSTTLGGLGSGAKPGGGRY